jgi:hypothetical protein
MKLEQLIGQLDKLLLSQSNDFAEMRRLLHEIQKTRDVYRWMDSAQDGLYASIASGHLKVLQHLEEGQLKNAKREAAAAVAWFYHRFQAFEHDTNERMPQVEEVFHRVAEVAKHSPVLREVLQKPGEEIASEFFPGGRKH